MNIVNKCIEDIGRARSTIFSTLDIIHGFWQSRNVCWEYLVYVLQLVRSDKLVKVYCFKNTFVKIYAEWKVGLWKKCSAIYQLQKHVNFSRQFRNSIFFLTSNQSKYIVIRLKCENCFAECHLLLWLNWYISKQQIDFLVQKNCTCHAFFLILSILECPNFNASFWPNTREK
jgi:hypothetical protein